MNEFSSHLCQSNSERRVGALFLFLKSENE